MPSIEVAKRRLHMNGIIYLVGLIVVVMFILSLFGLR
ncbi:putative nucleic acid-binding Zn ribbon protein [Bradyrhizobium sp. i1.4.4]